MNDSFESDERKRKETIECLYWSLMNGWDIPKDIREHYGFTCCGEGLRAALFPSSRTVSRQAVRGTGKAGRFHSQPEEY